MPNTWQFKLDQISVKIGLTTTTFCPNNGCQAIINPRSTKIIGPESQAGQLNFILFGLANKTGGVFDCQKWPSLPQIEFKIGGVSFPITADEYAIGPYYEECKSYILGNKQQSFWILNSWFVNKYFTIFDADQMKIGLAVKNELLYP